MNIKQKNILIEGVKTAGNKIKKQLGKIKEKTLIEINPFDYRIPADKASEKIILDTIKKTKLRCKVISEESEFVENLNTDYTIYLDPLDGSINFSRGIPVFCIGLGVYKNNEPILGIIYDICMDEMFVAEKNKGTSVNGKKIIPTLMKSKTLINLEWFGAPSYEKIISKLKKSNIRARTAGSGILALLYGCIGRGDGAILVSNRPWDIAPGIVFAKELGLTIQQLNGKDVDLSIKHQDIIAAPNKIFKKVKKALIR